MPQGRILDKFTSSMKNQEKKQAPRFSMIFIQEFVP